MLRFGYDFITEEMFQELQPFVQFKKSINKDKNADLAKRFDEISADLDGFTRQYKDDIGSSFLNQIISLVSSLLFSIHLENL